PGAVQINFNLAYMALSKGVPNFDLTKVVPNGTVDADVSNFNASDKCDIGGHGLWTQYMPTAGGRDDIGLVPAGDVRYLYTMTAAMQQLLKGMADCSGSAPFHVRESDNGRLYDSGASVSAFGRPVSIDARPGVYLPDLSFPTTDQLAPVGQTGGSGWAV